MPPSWPTPISVPGPSSTAVVIALDAARAAAAREQRLDRHGRAVGREPRDLVAERLARVERARDECRSEPQIPAERTRTRTPSPAGRGTSTTSITRSRARTARMARAAYSMAGVQR